MAKRKALEAYQAPEYPTLAEAHPTRRQALALIGVGVSTVLLKACGGMQPQPSYYYDSPALPRPLASPLRTGEVVVYDLYVQHDSDGLNQLMQAEPEAVKADLDLLFLAYSGEDLMDPEVVGTLQQHIAQGLEQLHAERFGAGIGSAYLSVYVDILGIES